MNSDNGTSRDTASFSARLTPHRSLTRGGFLAVMIALGGLSFIGGIIFLAMGAWPVVGFLGLDVLLVYWAFRANYRAAAEHEEIFVSASELLVRKVSASGAIAEWTANPRWVRIEREDDEEFGLQRLYLVSRGSRLAIASFLGPDEKQAFAEALSSALAEAKYG
jgi:uncharacterized membrane protein